MAEKIDNVRNELENAIIPELNWLADELNKLGFLSSGTYEDIKSTHMIMRSTQLAGALVEDVRRRAKLDPNAMNTFLGVLEKKALQLKPAIDYLRPVGATVVTADQIDNVRNELELSIIPELTWLADELNKLGFLSSGTYEDIKSSRYTLRTTQMASALVSDVRRRVQLEPNALEVFLEILQKKSLQLQPAINLLQPKDLPIVQNEAAMDANDEPDAVTNLNVQSEDNCFDIN